MKSKLLLLVLFPALLTVIIFACSGEESRTKLSHDETYDTVRNGARLILSYDADINTFIGTVENTTNKTLI
jgi:hypothetical protein